MRGNGLQPSKKKKVYSSLDPPGPTGKACRLDLKTYVLQRNVAGSPVNALTSNVSALMGEQIILPVRYPNGWWGTRDTQ